MLRRESNKKKETRVDYNLRLFFFIYADCASIEQI